MTQRYVWRVFCPSSNQYETTISATEPTVCPSDGITPVDPNFTTIMQSEFYDVTSRGYVNIESQLADNQAIKINASDINGGIDIDAGLGGITVDTTNSIQLNAGAASNFTTSNGNLTLQADAGLVNIDAGSGINIGNNSTTTPILIGSSAFSKNLTIGNTSGTSTTNIRAGTGGFNVTAANGGTISLNATGTSANITLNTNANGQDLTLAVLGSTDSSLSLISNGTGSDSFNLTTNGGMTITSFGSNNSIAIATDFATNSNIRLSGSVGGSGSIILESGSSGISINAYNGGLIGIGHFSGGDISIATAAVARTITFGNNTDSTKLYLRFGTGGLIKSQNIHTTLGDSDATLTIDQLLTRIILITPTANRTLTLPTAALAATAVSSTNDGLSFVIINDSSPTNAAFLTINVGTGGSIIGNNTIAPKQDSLGTYFTPGSAKFKMRFTNIGSGSEAYVVYRIA